MLLEELVEEERIRTLTNQMPCSEEKVLLKCVIDCDYFKKLQKIEKFVTYVVLPLAAILLSLMLLYVLLEHFLADSSNIAAADSSNIAAADSSNIAIAAADADSSCLEQQQLMMQQYCCLMEQLVHRCN